VSISFFFGFSLVDLWLTSHFTVVARENDAITIQSLIEFQDFLFSLEAAGSALGVVTCHCAVSIADQGSGEDRTMEGPLDLRDDNETFKTFFRLTAKRGVLDIDVNSLIQHHIDGTVPFVGEVGSDDNIGDQMCGRCSVEGRKKKFKQCRQVILNDKKMLHGACTNCAYNGGYAACSFTGKFSKLRSALFSAASLS
jgi:hypothetical protein